MAEPPFGEIVDLFKIGQVVPFLGAGVNFGTREPKTANWLGRESNFLPSGRELSNWLADKISFPSSDDHDRDDLPKVASYFAETSARARLRQRLQEIFYHPYKPSLIHHYLARIARHEVDGQAVGKPLLIVTTNYDDLTEQAFRSMNPPRPYDLVVYPTDREEIKGSVLWWKHGAEDPVAVPTNRLYVDLDNVNVIYKMHGSVMRGKPDLDSYVITEEDYVDFLSSMISQRAIPPLFMRHFRSRHFLFLGYGLQDWNLRVVLKNLKSPDFGATDDGAGLADPVTLLRISNDLRSWAIQFRPSEFEIALWNARHVKIYDFDINEFVRRLTEAEEK